MKIDIIILSDPDYYPPTINAANILAERGHEVRLIGIRYPLAQRQKLHPSIRRTDYGSHRTGLRNVLQYFSIYCRYFFRMGSNRPDWIIAYDSMSVGPVRMAAGFFKVRWVFHNHDLLINPAGWYKLIGTIERRWAKRATIVSFPQEDRAKGFMEIAGLRSFPQIVYNGPRKSWSEIKLEAHPALKRWVSEGKFIVLYQGQFSKYFNLHVLIKSFSLTSDKTVLCFIGRELEPGLIAEYQQIIKSHNLEDRVKILSSVPYDEVPSVTGVCHLGVAKLGMNKNIPFNDYYLTGASNKVSEYLAFGLPVLMADTEVNREFYTKHGMAVFANGDSFEDVASAIDNLAGDMAGRYKELRMSAERAGRDVFNYDIQFHKIVSILENQ
jgi:glycosyltransferase involved in cell wall biosynthesis